MLKPTVNTEPPPQFVHGPTLYRTGPNRYRLLCAVCGELCFASAGVFRRASRAILEGQDNPFLCRNCDHEGEEVWRFAE
ncbi:MAG TPA: hypothetical protein VGC87_03020 [Pyrinomonadaceae bacterium]|jgi:hypothetical protein